MGYESLKSILFWRFSKTPARYSSVKYDELGSRSQLPPRSRSSFMTSEVWKSLFLVLLSALFTSVITCITIWSFTSVRRCDVRVSDSPLIRTPVPQFPKEIRVFEENTTYSDPPTPENNQAWNDLLPSGRGFVFVDNGAQYGLQPGIDAKPREIYSVALYHQIHCLGLVRRNYWRLVNGLVNGNPEAVDQARKELHHSHTAHCFDYFRQSFECSADMSLEWPKTEPGGERTQVDGVGIPHVCTNKQAVEDYMHANQFHGAHNHEIAARGS